MFAHVVSPVVASATHPKALESSARQFFARNQEHCDLSKRQRFRATFPCARVARAGNFRAVAREQAGSIWVTVCVLWLSRLSTACLSASPPVAPGTGAAGGDGRLDAANARWADTVIAVTSPAGTVACTSGVGACGETPAACAADALLGPADGQSFALGAASSVEVAFRCAPIVGHGADADDFTVWCTVPDGSSGVVEVSDDGGSFDAVELLTRSDQSFSLARIGRSTARFVRVTNAGTVSLALDAVQAL
jgi:hypothetical protein